MTWKNKGFKFYDDGRLDNCTPSSWPLKLHSSIQLASGLMDVKRLFSQWIADNPLTTCLFGLAPTV